MPLVLNGTTGVQDNSGAFVSGTAVSASGTSVDFTGIPSWVKQITVMFQTVSQTGNDNFLIQLGTSSGIINSGYVSSSVGGGSSTSTAGFIISEDTNSQSLCGQHIISQFSSSSWNATGLYNRDGAATLKTCSGKLTGAGTIDRIRITTTGGTNTFDAGTINILYE
jgi:hypothetical protein